MVLQRSFITIGLLGLDLKDNLKTINNKKTSKKTYNTEQPHETSASYNNKFPSSAILKKIKKNQKISKKYKKKN